jgi:hypothetical protein
LIRFSEVRALHTQRQHHAHDHCDKNRRKNQVDANEQLREPIARLVEANTNLDAREDEKRGDGAAIAR